MRRQRCSGLGVWSTESRLGSTLCAYSLKVGVGAHGAEPKTNPAWLLHLRYLWESGSAPPGVERLCPVRAPVPCVMDAVGQARAAWGLGEHFLRRPRACLDPRKPPTTASGSWEGGLW